MKAILILISVLAVQFKVIYANGDDGYYYHNIDFLDIDTDDDEQQHVEISVVSTEAQPLTTTEDDIEQTVTDVELLKPSQPMSYRNSKCEMINMKLCKTPDIKYNFTLFPNSHGHKTQIEAAEALFSFNVLIESQCSIYIRLFLCSEFIPMCALRPIAESNIYIEEPLKPCKSMCSHVKSKCELLLLSVGIKWPKILDCSRLPEDNMCIRPPVATSVKNNFEYEDYLISNLQSPYENNMNKLINHIRTKNLNNGNNVLQAASSLLKDKIIKKVTETQKNSTKANIKPNTDTNTLCMNRKQFLPVSFILNAQQSMKSFKKTSLTTLDNLNQCVPICSQDVLFTENEKYFTELCSFILALICFITTLFVLILYIFKSNLFQYPEHIIVIISFCYNIYSIPFIIRFFLGYKKVSCENYNYHLNIDNLFDALFYPAKATTTTTTKRLSKIAASISLESTTDNTYVLVKESLENTWCTVTFILTYFFQTASTIWWVILSFIWFLISNRKYSPKLFRTLNNYYHLFAWTIPTIFTIIALIWKRVDADELTGMCSVGNQDTHALLMLKILPFCVYLLFGIVCLVAGFIAIYKVRDKPKQQQPNSQHQTPTEELKSDSDLIENVYYIQDIDKILFKIGIFSIIFVIPVIYLILSNLYHFMNYNVWYLNKVSSTNDETTGDIQVSNYPITEIYIFKLFISFLMGVSSFVWILTSNASRGLLRFLRNLLCQCLFCNNMTVKTITRIDKHSSASTRHINDRGNVRLKNSTTLMRYQHQSPQQLQQQQHHQQQHQQHQQQQFMSPYNDENFFSNNQIQFQRSFMIKTPAAII